MRRKEEAGRKAPDPVRALERYGDMVYRIALLHMKNQSDAEDVFQDVFLRLVRYAETIEGEEHLKHWLIRVTVNCCKKTVCQQLSETDSSHGPGRSGGIVL